MTSTGYITVHDTENGLTRKQKREGYQGTLIEVHVDHIAAIMPRSSYTTLIVGGKYMHVSEQVAEIHRRISVARGQM